MALIHFAPVDADCDKFDEDFGITTDTLDTTTCPSCIILAEAEEVATHVMTHHVLDPACRLCAV